MSYITESVVSWSTTDYPHNSPSLYHQEWVYYAEHYIPVTVFLTVVFLAGVFGNAATYLLYLTVYAKSNHRVLVLWLSMVDFLSVIIGIPFVLYDLHNSLTFRSAALCKIGKLLGVFFPSFSLGLLTFIAIVRYWKVCKPFRMGLTTTKSHTICAVIGVVIFLVLAVPALTIYGVKILDRGYNETGHDCTIAEDISALTTVHRATNAVVFTMALLACLVLYGLVGKTLVKRAHVCVVDTLTRTGAVREPSHVVNTVDRNVNANTLERNVNANMLGRIVNANTLERNVNANTLERIVNANTLERNVNANTLGRNVIANTLERKVNANTLERIVNANTLVRTVKANTLGRNLTANTFGRNVKANTVGRTVKANTLGKNVTANTLVRTVNDKTLRINAKAATIGRMTMSGTLGRMSPANALGNVNDNALSHNVASSRHYPNSDGEYSNGDRDEDVISDGYYTEQVNDDTLVQAMEYWESVYNSEDEEEDESEANLSANEMSARIVNCNACCIAQSCELRIKEDQSCDIREQSIDQNINTKLAESAEEEDGQSPVKEIISKSNSMEHTASNAMAKDNVDAIVSTENRLPLTEDKSLVNVPHGEAHKTETEFHIHVTPRVNRGLERSRRLSFIFLIVTALSFSTCLPFLIFSTVKTIDPSITKTIAEHADINSFLNYFYFLNSAINPLVYGFMDSKFRRELKSYCRLIKRRLASCCKGRDTYWPYSRH